MAKKKKGCGCGCSVIIVVLVLWAIGVFFFAVVSNDEIDPINFDDIAIETEATTEDSTQAQTEDVTENETETDTEPETQEQTQEQTQSPTESPVDLMDTSIYRGRMYNELNSIEKHIYDEMTNALSQGELKFNIDGVSDGQAYLDASTRAYDAVYADHPEFFWLNGAWKAQSSGVIGSQNVKYDIACYDYWNYTMDKNGYIDAVMTAARDIATQASAYSTDYDKMKFVHDYLVDNVTYDHFCADKDSKTKPKVSSQQSHTVYGALINDLAVCDGYAKTYQLVMNMLGIECEYIDGDAGGGHAWNFMKLDGKYYWMDVTWDDPDSQDYPHSTRYWYFNVDDKTLKSDHTPENKVMTPSCNSLDYSYYACEGAYLNTYDFSKVCAAAQAQQSDGCINLKFANNSEYKKAVKDLFANKKWAKIPQLSGKTIIYETADNLLSITITY